MQTEPIDPFERWVDRPNLPSKRKIFRPLHYVLAHQFLPTALFAEHQIIQELFSSEIVDSTLMSNLWQLAADECMSARAWSPLLVLSSSGYKEYLNLMAAQSSRHLRALREYDVCLLEMPPAIASVEAFMVALCRPRAIAGKEFDASKARRLFTLECSTEPADQAVMCEWGEDKKHLNYGQHPILSRDKFLKLIAEKLYPKSDPWWKR